MRQLLAMLAITSVCLPALAQHDHAHHGAYASMVDRDIKALSSQQVDELMGGLGMGLSLPAELNSTPGPMHLLELQETLGLSEAQVRQLDTIVQRMRTDAKTLGKSIIESERQLDLDFKHRKATAASVDSQTQQIAQLMGRLRAVHLKAHLAATALLTPRQIADYERARGYARSHHEPARATQ